MSKCDCYRIEPERHHFAYENGVMVCEYINVPRCLGTREKDVCCCDGNRSQCSFYGSIREKAAEEKKSLSTTQNALEEIEDLIGEYWGTDPIYYIDSKNEEEAGAAKLCCKILEAIRIAQRGEKNEKDS